LAVSYHRYATCKLSVDSPHSASPEDGADPNARAKDRMTPLTTALASNNHGVLQILLDRWDQDGAWSGQSALEILNVAAYYADLDSIGMLSATAHLKHCEDKQNVLAARTSERMRNRPNVSEELVAAFENLLCSIQRRVWERMRRVC